MFVFRNVDRAGLFVVLTPRPCFTKCCSGRLRLVLTRKVIRMPALARQRVLIAVLACSKPFQEPNERNECVCTAPFEADMASGSLRCRLKAAITTSPVPMTEYAFFKSVASQDGADKPRQL